MVVNPRELLIRILSEFPFIEVAILYGSFAKGLEKPTSDIDLGIAGSRPLSPEEMVQVQTRLSNAIGREIDLIDLQVATGTVFKEALSEGVCLIKKDPHLLAGLLKKMLLEQADFEPLRQQILETKRKQVLR